MHLPMRTIGMIAGLIGAGVGLALTLLYSIWHLISQTFGITPDAPHFLLGVVATILAVAGALLALVFGEIGAVLLLVATVAFFFVLGWWAILPALLLLPAAGLAYWYRASRTRGRAVAG